jgi:hypothetical protein
MSSSSKPATVVLGVSDWNPQAIRYTPPKVNDRGGKSVNVLSSQTGRWLHVSTPLMMTWGVADFVDEKGESDGKFSMTLNFPNGDYATKSTTDFLEKFKSFENQVLDDAVKYSELWFGEEMSREVAKHTFFSSLKYTKDKLTKKIDNSKAHSIRAKVPNYTGRWNMEIFNTKNELIFPCENENLTPMDFIPKKSQVACVLQCGGLWFGGKGWGITWKVNQAVVKPQEMLTVFGKCHIQLSSDELQQIESQPVVSSAVDEDEEVLEATVKSSTDVADSDEEEEEAETEPVKTADPEPVKKKVVKRAATPVMTEEEPVAVAVEPAKKKVIKKKAT